MTILEQNHKKCQKVNKESQEDKAVIKKLEDEDVIKLA